MTCLEVLGGGDAIVVANALRRLDSEGQFAVTVRAAPPATAAAVALSVAAPSVAAMYHGAELALHADVALVEHESLPDQAARLWYERLSLFGAALRDEGQASSPAVLHAFDPRWAAAAGRGLRRLQAALTNVGAAQGAMFDHIGSTSVPGLSAKPILDLQVRVLRLRYDADFDRALRRVGYKPAVGSRPDSPGVDKDTPRGSEPVPDDVWDKRLFVSPDPAQPAILHIRQSASPWGRFTVQFRDWLRDHPAEAARYERVKRQLAQAHEFDLDYDDYTRGKTAYFDDIQAQFESWGR